MNKRIMYVIIIIQIIVNLYFLYYISGIKADLDYIYGTKNFISDLTLENDKRIIELEKHINSIK